MTISYSLLPEKEYRQTLSHLYSSDSEFLPDYLSFHPELSTLDDCIDHTVNLLTEKVKNFEFWCIFVDNKIAGYFGKELFFNVTCITGFFIKPEHRNKDFIKAFWAVVKAKINTKLIICAAHKKNIKAQNFLLKGGFEFLAEGDDIITYHANSSTSSGSSSRGDTGDLPLIPGK